MQTLRTHYDARRPGWQLLDQAGNLRDRLTTLRIQSDRWEYLRHEVARRRPQRPMMVSSLEPRVSLVIPVANDSSPPAPCLASLAAFPPRSAVEVIVVDTSSTGADLGIDPASPIRVLRTRCAHGGLVRSVTLAMEHLQGNLVLVAAADTLLLPGCVDALADALEDPAIGAAGAKLVDSSGRLIAAGGLVWRDGVRWSIGHGRSPFAPEYNFRRDVDYCSSAALMVRRDVLASLLGDDEATPDDYFDADVAFTARDQGLRVVYEPRAEALTGADGSVALRRWPNGDRAAAVTGHLQRMRFERKWRPALRFQRTRPMRRTLRAEFEGSDTATKPRVLVCDWAIPTPDRDSGGQRMDWILRLLQPMCSWITFVPTRRYRYQEYAAALECAGIEVVTGVAQPLRKVLEARSGLYDFVLLSRSQVAQRQLSVVKDLLPLATIVFDTVELKSQRLMQQLLATGAVRDGNLRRELDIEDRLIRGSDVIVTVSADESATVRARWPEARTAVLPNVHQVATRAIPGLEARRDLLFIGNFTHPPNADAVTWFCAAVLPLIRAEADVRLVVIGPGAPGSLVGEWGPHVSYLGWVPQAEAQFDAARVMVAPLRYGAGMKGKVGHALAMGIPVVTTSVGAEGMDLVNGVHALVADGARAFADAVLRLHTDDALWRSISAAGIDAVAKRWSPDVMRMRLNELLASVAPPKPAEWMLAAGAANL